MCVAAQSERCSRNPVSRTHQVISDGVMMFRNLIGLLMPLAFAGVPCEAVTKNFSYLGAIAELSNYPETGRPTFQTATLSIDVDLMPGGTLANLEISCRTDGACWNHRLNEDAIEYTFDHGPTRGFQATSYRMKFDAEGNLKNWRFGWYNIIGPPSSYLSSQDGWDSFGPRFDDTLRDAAHNVATRFLNGLGYVEGSKRYNELLCGSWAGESCGAGEPSASLLWAAGFSSGPGGRWFDDPAEHAEALRLQTLEAELNPPVSYYDIPPAPVPLPAALGLLSGAAVLLMGVGWRRRSV